MEFWKRSESPDEKQSEAESGSWKSGKSESQMVNTRQYSPEKMLADISTHLVYNRSLEARPDEKGNYDESESPEDRKPDG